PCADGLHLRRTRTYAGSIAPCPPSHRDGPQSLGGKTLGNGIRRCPAAERSAGASIRSYLPGGTGQFSAVGRPPRISTGPRRTAVSRGQGQVGGRPNPSPRGGEVLGGANCGAYPVSVGGCGK